MKKIVLNIFAVAVVCFGVNAQSVNIPDANFKACLLAYPNINTNGDSEIQVSEANAFTGGFTCVNQNISDLTGIEAFTSMTILDCSNNNLSSLNISQNTALKRLFCSDNNLNNLDVSQNPSLEYIVCGDNNLNSLDISQNTNLSNFQCQNNNLSSIDVSPHWNLKTFRCQGNNLLSLDVSNNTQLQDFQCQNNQLTSLNIKNVNWSVFWVNATSNPNLTCIEVDDVATANAASTNIDPQTSFSTSCSAIVNIPDTNFKTYLVGNSSINTNNDSEIQVSEAAAFTGTIDCNSKSISDLTGIEAFTALTELHCQLNNLTNLDVSQNTALTNLYCNNNNLSTLDLSQNSALTLLFCGDNNLTILDISQNTDLTTLQSTYSTSNGNLSTINLNTNLTHLYCNNSGITTLDVSQTTGLIQLICRDNNLSTLDVSQNTALTSIYCDNNNLSTLDVSQNTALTYLLFSNNMLTEVNMKNLSVNQLTYFNATSNPNLTCIEVDDVAAATTALTNIDAQTSFSENCSTVAVTSITVQGQAGASTISTLGGTLQMEASVLPMNATNSTYTWSIVNTTGSATINSSGLLTATTDGTVTVTASAVDGSGVTGSAVITISNQSSNIREQSIIHNLSIYPNPANAQIIIDAEEQIEAITILDIMGKTVKTIIEPNQTIDVSDLAKGIYFFQIQIENTLVNKKIIKE